MAFGSRLINTPLKYVFCSLNILTHCCLFQKGRNSKTTIYYTDVAYEPAVATRFRKALPVYLGPFRDHSICK